MLIAVIAAWTLIAVADIFGRAIAKAATQNARGVERAAEATATIVLMPKALAAKRLKGHDEPGFLVVASRNGEKGPVMLVKDGKQPEWVERDEVEYTK